MLVQYVSKIVQFGADKEAFLRVRPGVLKLLKAAV